LKLWWHLGARFLAKNLLPSNPTGVGVLQGKPMPQHVPPITHIVIMINMLPRKLSQKRKRTRANERDEWTPLAHEKLVKAFVPQETSREERSRGHGCVEALLENERERISACRHTHMSLRA
jgi:hypothetical protein